MCGKWREIPNLRVPGSGDQARSGPAPVFPCYGSRDVLYSAGTVTEGATTVLTYRKILSSLRTQVFPNILLAVFWNQKTKCPFWFDYKTKSARLFSTFLRPYSVRDITKAPRRTSGRNPVINHSELWVKLETFEHNLNVCCNTFFFWVMLCVAAVRLLIWLFYQYWVPAQLMLFPLKALSEPPLNRGDIWKNAVPEKVFLPSQFTSSAWAVVYEKQVIPVFRGV